MTQREILIVEDESILALDLRMHLEDLAYKVVGTVASGEAAIDSVARHVPDLVLMDVRLQGELDGIQAAARIGASQDVPIIFLTAHSDPQTVQRAAATAPYGYLTKPYEPPELRAAIEVALTKYRLERQLREADRWFAQTLRCVQDGVLVTGIDGHVRFLNPAAERLTGWALSDASGRDVDDVVKLAHEPASGAAGAIEPHRSIDEVLRLGRPTSLGHGLLLQRRGARAIAVDPSAGPVDDDAGQRMGAVLVLRDATQRQAQEKRLRASEQRFRNAFDFAPLGMALVSMSGELLQSNSAFVHLLGTSAEGAAVIGHTALTDEADRALEAERLRELAGRGGVVQFEKRYRRVADGEPVWTLASVSLIHEDGQPMGYLYQVHDLTEQRKAARHLDELADERMKREASELASQAKSAFLSRVSHEMRTPLNAVIGFAQLLQLAQDDEPGRTQRYARQILEAGEHLLAVVNDLLDLQRAAQGLLQVTPQPVALRALLDSVLQFVEVEARARAIGFQLALAPDEAPVVTADPVRLRQVLLNVLSNAIKYNRPDGMVRIGLQPPTAAGRVALTIEDEGVGMTDDQMKRLFQPFDRLGRETSAVPGTGLGLVIARSLMQQMGGTLEVSSQARAGTRVTLELARDPGA